MDVGEWGGGGGGGWWFIDESAVRDICASAAAAHGHIPHLNHCAGGVCWSKIPHLK